MSAKIYNVLIIDDDLEFHKDIRFALRKSYLFDSAIDQETLREKVKYNSYDLVLLDLVLEEKSTEKTGLKLVPFLNEHLPIAPIVVITADGNVDTVVQAMKMGVMDYVHKADLNFDLLDVKFRRIIENEMAKQENNKLRAEIQQLRGFETAGFPFLGESESILRIKKILRAVADTPNITLLITGETGVGKEVAARYMHNQGVRRNKPFQAVNLSAIQKTLLESELFGHIKGAFTGATHNKEGYFRQADGGVLMLDEIGDIDHNIQVKLLRFLETKLIRPVGSDQDIKLDVQVIAATHKNLEEEIKKGLFREDLYQRLKAKIVHIPPLRERISDIPIIITHLLSLQALPVEILEPEVLELLCRYTWRGNVRELKYTLESLLLEKRILEKSTIDLECLPAEIVGFRPIHTVENGRRDFDNLGAPNTGLQSPDNEKMKVIIDLDSIEKALVERNKVKGDAARDLGFKSADHIRYRVKTYFDKYPDLFDRYPMIRVCYKKIF